MVDIPTTIQSTAYQSTAIRSPGQPDNPLYNPRMRAEAERFEAAFLAEMLRHSGFGQMPESFNGGPGEAAFAGTLVQEYANRIAATGTLGIADRIYQTLVEQSLK